MKKLLLPLLLVAAFACQPSGETRQQATGSASHDSLSWNSYGHEIKPEGAVNTQQLVALAEGRDSLALKVRAEVLHSCPVKGCWMKVKLADGQEMRVTFKDYGFFVPKDLKGEEAVFEGILSRSVTDVETLQHFARDEGASEEDIRQITQPEEGYVFEASGVLLKTREP